MSNLLFVLWMSLSAGLLLLFFYAAFLNLRNRRVRDVDLGEMIPSFLPVDVEAFAGLVGSALTEIGHKMGRIGGAATVAKNDDLPILLERSTKQFNELRYRFDRDRIVGGLLCRDIL